MAAANCTLPDEPHMEQVGAFVEYVNRKSIEHPVIRSGNQL